jgi:selenocysteine lyase/cysteine desulfurase
MWVTWGQGRWRESARRYEDYGTRNFAEMVTLGNALDFQERVGADVKESRYREIWNLFREMTDNSDRVTWRSSRDWSLSASLFAIEINGKTSTDVSERMHREHGFVFRPFRTQQLNHVRISPNVYNTEDEGRRFFELVGQL